MSTQTQQTSVIKSALAAGSFTLRQVEPAVKRTAVTVSKVADLADNLLEATNGYAIRWKIDSMASALEAIDNRKQANETRKEFINRLKSEFEELK